MYSKRSRTFVVMGGMADLKSRPCDRRGSHWRVEAQLNEVIFFYVKHTIRANALILISVWHRISVLRFFSIAFNSSNFISNVQQQIKKILFRIILFSVLNVINALGGKKLRKFHMYVLKVNKQKKIDLTDIPWNIILNYSLCCI